jgi:hypothetical protein
MTKIKTLFNQSAQRPRTPAKIDREILVKKYKSQ